MSVQAGDVIVHRRPFRLVGHFELPPDRMSVVEFTERFGRQVYSAVNEILPEAVSRQLARFQS